MAAHRRRQVGLVLVMLAVGACEAGSAAPAGNTPPPPTVVPGPVSTPQSTPRERVIGNGFAVLHEMAAADVQPTTSQGSAMRVVQEEIAAGRAMEIPRRAPLPPFEVVEVAFSSALVDVINPWQAHSYDAGTPVAAWVVVLDGAGPDGRYSGLGVIDDATGRPLVVQVWLPGA